MLSSLVAASKLHKHRVTRWTAEWPYCLFAILWYYLGLEVHSCVWCDILFLVFYILYFVIYIHTYIHTNLLFAAQCLPLLSFVDIKLFIIFTIREKAWNLGYLLKTFLIRNCQCLEWRNVLILLIILRIFLQLYIIIIRNIYSIQYTYTFIKEQFKCSWAGTLRTNKSAKLIFFSLS